MKREAALRWKDNDEWIRYWNKRIMVKRFGSY